MTQEPVRRTRRTIRLIMYKSGTPRQSLEPVSSLKRIEMSLELIEKEIRRLLGSSEPEVACISGHWGVGKTFAWRHYLAEAQAMPGGIALNRYSYVSLFGINSLDELKYAIFENTVNAKAAGQEPGLKTLKKNATSLGNKAKKAIPFLQQLPYVKNYVGGGAAPLWFMWVRGTIVCIDDIERRGDKLTVRDVLGLVSHLKEQKKCKVVLILNDEKLQGETENFRTYFEKVVDVSLHFEPTPEESARIALTESDKVSEWIAGCCMNLGIANIRIIKKIERAVRMVQPSLTEFDEAIWTQAVQSLVLLAWCVYEPGNAPPIDYVRAFNLYMLSIGEDPVGEEEAGWNNTLMSYKFTSMSELDNVLLDGIRDGYFDIDTLKKHAADLDQEIKAGKAGDSFREAWEKFHGSFDDNQEEVLDAIVASLKENINVISAPDLDATVWLLNGLGRPDEAAEVIDFYVAQKDGTRDQFDLERLPFGSEVKDPDVRAAFAKKLDSFKEERDPVGILQSIANKHGWSQDDIDVLSRLDSNVFYNIFKSHSCEEMQRFILTCLEFGKMGDQGWQYKVIVTRTTEALERIGRESPMNAFRVKRYGVRIDDGHSDQGPTAGIE